MRLHAKSRERRQSVPAVQALPAFSYAREGQRPTPRPERHVDSGVFGARHEPPPGRSEGGSHRSA